MGGGGVTGVCRYSRKLLFFFLVLVLLSVVTVLFFSDAFDLFCKVP